MTGEPAAATTPSEVVVFVGGSGRSGTTIVSRIVGKHSRFETIPIEVRFHTDDGGLADLLNGKGDVTRFVAQMRDRWYYRELAHGETRGLHKIIERPAFEEAVDRFAADFPERPLPAARRLLRDILDPWAARAGKPSWLEMSPPNARLATILIRMFPQGKVLHTIRDGRDVACSVVPLSWGPPTYGEAIPWWEEEVRAAHEASRRLPPGTVMTVRLEDLVLERRDETYAAILEFLEIDDEPAMRAYFDDEVEADRAHVGRWQHDLTGEQLERVNETYMTALTGMQRDGISGLPTTVALSERRTERLSWGRAKVSR